MESSGAGFLLRVTQFFYNGGDGCTTMTRLTTNLRSLSGQTVGHMNYITTKLVF